MRRTSPSSSGTSWPCPERRPTTTTSDEAPITGLIMGGDLLTAISRFADMGIKADDNAPPTTETVRRIGWLNDIPVYLDEFLPPDKVLVMRKSKDQFGP